MQHPTGWPEGSSGDAPFLWWDGDRWTQEVSSPQPPDKARPPDKTVWQPAVPGRPEGRPARKRFPEYQRALDRLRETRVELLRADWLKETRFERLGETIVDRLREPRFEPVLDPSGEIPVDDSDENDADDVRHSIATLALSGLFAISFVILLAGFGLDSAALRLTGVLGVLFFGVGAAPIKAFRHTGFMVRLALAVLLGISIPTLLASVMVLTPLWHPVVAAALLGIAAVVIHVRGSREALNNLRAADRRLLPPIGRSSWLNLSTGLTAAGTLYWVGGAVISGHISPGVGGFVTQIIPLWYVGVLLVVGGMILARGRAELAAILGVVSLVAALTFTPALVYGLPRIQTASKHVGFVQQVLSAHYLDPHAGIYQAYSGFFSLGGWICYLAGVRDSIGLATYWPFIIDVVGLAVLRLFFGVLLRSAYRIYVALALTFLVDVVGQDYFSPQSVGYVLVFGVYALGVGGQRTNLSRRTRMGLILVISCAVAVTHEFSPYIGAAVLAIFVVTRLARPIYLPLAAALPAALWALANRSVLGGFISLSDLGDLSNFEPPKTVATPGLERLPVVGQTSDAALLGLLVLIGLAGVGFLAAVTRRSGWRFFSPIYAWAMLGSAIAGLGLIVANPYGNEGIFRSVLFAIPWLAAFAVTAVPRTTRGWMVFPFAMLLTGLAATYCISTFGLDNAGVIRPGDINALNFYNTKASSSGYILDLSYGDTPTGIVSLDDGHYVTWSAVVPQSGGLPTPLNGESAALLARNYLAYVANNSGSTNQLYALWSPASVDYAVDYGLESATTAVAWENALSSSPIWKLVYNDDGTYLFQLAPQ